MPKSTKSKPNRLERRGSKPLASKSTTMKKRAVPKRGLKTIILRDLESQSKMLCSRITPKKPDQLLDSCISYKNNWVNAKYGMSQVNEENSPLYIFKEMNAEENNLDDIKDGIHNFMLFFDEARQTYELVTSYFNAIEFGSKHNIIACRTIGKTANKFLLSGEINKNGNDIVFQTISSQYFDNDKSLLKHVSYKYLQEIIAGVAASGKDPDAELDSIKREFIGAVDNPNFGHPGVHLVNMRHRLGEVVDHVVNYSGRFYPLQGSVLDAYYVDIIESHMQDAFNKIFPNTFAPVDDSDADTSINVSYVKSFVEADYKDQKNTDIFFEEMCQLPRPVEFDVYTDEEGCHSKAEAKKALYNSCHIPPALAIGGTRLTRRTKRLPPRRNKKKRKSHKIKK